MEKSEEAYTGRPPSWLAYQEFSRRNHLDSIINEVGVGFSVGSVIGFLRHLLKDKQGVRSALGKSPRLGGLWALCSLGVGVALHANYKLRGGTVTDTNWEDPNIIIVAGTVAVGFIFAPPGRLFYPRYALAWGGISSSVPFQSAHHTRSTSSLCDLNTYSYPHYRHPPQYNSMPKIPPQYNSMPKIS